MDSLPMMDINPYFLGGFSYCLKLIPAFAGLGHGLGTLGVSGNHLILFRTPGAFHG